MLGCTDPATIATTLYAEALDGQHRGHDALMASDCIALMIATDARQKAAVRQADDVRAKRDVMGSVVAHRATIKAMQCSKTAAWCYLQKCRKNGGYSPRAIELAERVLLVLGAAIAQSEKVMLAALRNEPPSAESAAFDMKAMLS